MFLVQGQNLLFSIKLQDLLWTRGRSKERMNFFSTAVYKKRKAHGQTALNKKETAKSSLSSLFCLLLLLFLLHLLLSLFTWGYLFPSMFCV